jgi:hypothetical protein
MARPRFRRCIECPKCLIRYLIAFSPYGNGSYLVPPVDGSSDIYTLYCSCRKPPVPSRWKGSEMKVWEVSKVAHDRGYGTTQEIVFVSHRYATRGERSTRNLNLKIAGLGENPG